jgi:DNA-binding response OmpR family regulator
MLKQATKSFTNASRAADTRCMSRTIGGVAGESDIAKGIPTETLGETHGSRHANASKTQTIMKLDLVLLLTRDLELEQEAATAAAASGVGLMLAGTVGEALEIIDERGRELDLVVIDFDGDTGWMTLLSALSMSPADLPIVALTSTDRDHSTVLACTDGVAGCLTKPMNAAELEMVIRVLGRSRLQADAAQSKRRIKPRISKLSQTRHTRGTIVPHVKEQTSLRKEA